MQLREETTTAVLLVDDEELVRRYYQTLLGGLGFEVETAPNGLEALELLKQRAFDVVVTDLSMPVMSGMQFLRAVRKENLDVPVILMTGTPGFDSAVAAVEYGAFRYLVKPVDRSIFVDTVMRAGTLHRLARLKRQALAMDGIPGMQLGDRASLDARFDRGLDGLWMAFQPIVDWRRQGVFGFEALVRSRDQALPGPADLFDAAERLHRVHDLGRAIRSRTAAALAAAPDDAQIFINVNAEELDDEELYSEHAPLAAFASRVIVEITERSTLESVRGLSQRIHKLRALGYRIAIDDLGAGYAGLSSFALLEPDFVKLDMSLVRGVDRSPRKRSIVRGMANLCIEELGIQVICEGVEHASERDCLAEDGVSLFQGYLFARPHAEFLVPSFA